jgi:hypothetical protein
LEDEQADMPASEIKKTSDIMNKRPFLEKNPVIRFFFKYRSIRQAHHNSHKINMQPSGR